MPSLVDLVGPRRRFLRFQESFQEYPRWAPTIHRLIHLHLWVINPCLIRAQILSPSQWMQTTEHFSATFLQLQTLLQPFRQLQEMNPITLGSAQPPPDKELFVITTFEIVLK